ncbi:aldehyde dehydrogenase, putative [Talaromyces stipitatus ATCC 10500]|uniref:aldehyde dehydrogenase (NAD(+)) n=1 Tax=Talaromyces stipitatus (strain ATCC 10500 / CBS 375.48 / QM 6759 / NRRL 1006) TaxID=441959 RepID=B8MQC9_TALSN|nr:aldehyde dehydrogenase, putative [Talaromyces stipitatus ATCC 10500]EED13331.1 aldehyde dehydrogenase, putative [Talaromyces stipitatus ATCC 10500]
MATPIETRLFINNEYVEAKSGQTIQVHNPVDGSLIASNIHVAGESDVDDAVAAATKAFKEGPWSQFTGTQRGKLLYRFADLLEQNLDEVVRLESLAMGIPVGGAKMIAQKIPAYFRYYAGYADKLEGDVFPPEEGSYNFVQYEPLGVVACIAAWNTTYLYYAWKIAPALAAGNTVIFKTSEKSPLGGLFIGKLFVEAGFPPGVVNLVTGAGQTGHLLAAHPKIRMISFTGSINTGRKVQEAAAKSNLKKVSLELGGKSPAIVFEDADLANAVPNLAHGFLFNSGQVCAAATRLYIHESISDKLIPILKSTFESISQGLGSSPLDPNTFIGPVADSAQFENVMRYIAEGKKTAQLITGGNQKGDKGFFIEPTIFYEPNPNAKIIKEEIFGPVLVVQTFKTEEEVIAMANDTEYGLSASIYTENISRALRVASKIESGSVAINCAFRPEKSTAFGGYKQSGNGTRESGKYGLHDFMQAKTIHVKL